MPIAGISIGLGLGGGTSATSSGAAGGGPPRAPFIPNAKSVLFDGTNDFFNLASEITFTGAFTFSVWVKPVSGNEGFISTGHLGSAGPWVDWYGPAYGNKLVVSRMGNISGPHGVNSMVAGTWYNTVIIRDASNEMKAYQNGSQVGSNSSFTGTAEFVMFAARANGPATFLNGYLDEIAFWDDALTPSEITAVYNSGVAGDLWAVSPPLHWYRLGDINSASGVTIADIGSAANNDGTLYNGPTYTTEVPS